MGNFLSFQLDDGSKKQWRWKLVESLAMLAMTGVDLGVGIYGLMAFESSINYSDADVELKRYVNMWIAGYVGEAIVGFSQLLLAIRIMWELCTWSDHWPYSPKSRPKKCVLRWSKANYICSFLVDDCIVGIAKILIAFSSPEAVEHLKTRPEQTSCTVSFVVSLAQLLLVFVQVSIVFQRSEKCCSAKILCNIFSVFMCCVAIAPPTLAMFISLSAFNIYHGDASDFNVNIQWLTIPPSSLFIFLLIVLFGCCKWCR